MTGRQISIWLVTFAVAVTACTSATPARQTEVATSTSTVTTPANVANVEILTAEAFPEFLAVVGGELLRRNPEQITELGLEDLMSQGNDDLNDLSSSYRAETAAIAAEALSRLNTLSTASLHSDDAISASILRWYLEDIDSLSEFPDHDYAVNYITGAHANLPEFLADIHPIDNLADARAYIARLSAAGDQMRQVADNLRRSVRAGILPTTTGIQIAGFQINNVLQPPSNHPLVSDLVERLAEIGDITDGDIVVLRQEAETALSEELLPGYRDLLNTVNQVVGRSETSPGVSDLPRGDDYYETILRHHVSHDIEPEEAHQVGLGHVDRLVDEISSALLGLGYDVDAHGFARSVGQATTDAGSFPLSDESSRQEVLTLATREVEHAQQTFSTMFTTFPQSPLLVVRPRQGREGGSGAYYRAPPAFGSRPGLYYLSLGGPALDRQTFSTTNYHEAVPGHHFQLALQRESRDLPLLQRAVTYNGFAEGWALYAERLAFEAGLYDGDPQGNLGRLRMELLRASRVVVDTGIHHLGWSRDKAIDYMTSLGFDEQRSSGEVDRYIVWPGQAPAYLLGMLEILRLREEATSALGSRFELAAFHTELLRHGSVPLAVLDDVVAAYIADNS